MCVSSKHTVLSRHFRKIIYRIHNFPTRSFSWVFRFVSWFNFISPLLVVTVWYIFIYMYIILHVFLIEVTLWSNSNHIFWDLLLLFFVLPVKFISVLFFQRRKERKKKNWKTNCCIYSAVCVPVCVRLCFFWCVSIDYFLYDKNVKKTKQKKVSNGQFYFFFPSVHQ